MDEGARLWLAKTARRNYWRVSRWYDLEDLIQEGYVAYSKTLRKYPGVTHAPHRMALFKRVFLNRLHDMANKRTRDAEEICMSEMLADDASGLPRKVVEFAAESSIEEALQVFASAPQYVKDAVALFTREADLVRLRSDYRKVRRGRWLCRETLNERLCRLTGYDPAQVDIVGGIRACLAGESEVV